MIDNRFNANGVEATAPLTHYETVTPSDTEDFPRVARALWVGTLGDISVVRTDGTAVIFVGASGFMPVRCVRVNATDTTATDIVWGD